MVLSEKTTRLVQADRVDREMWWHRLKSTFDILKENTGAAHLYDTDLKPDLHDT